MTQNKWIRIGVYYLIALAISGLARLYWHIGDLAMSLRGPWYTYLHLVSGAGPALGALAVCALFGYRSRITIAGTNLQLGLVMIAVPAAVLGFVGIPDPFGIDPHLFGVHMGVMIALYALLEEAGWRGYLQDEFADKPALLKYLIVGLFWYAWHFSWAQHPALGNELTTIGFMVLAAAGIGFVADRTHSVLAAAAFHIAGNIMGLTTDFARLIPQTHTRMVIVIACFVIWLVLLRIWRILDVRAERAEAEAEPAAQSR